MRKIQEKIKVTCHEYYSNLEVSIVIFMFYDFEKTVRKTG